MELVHAMTSKPTARAATEVLSLLEPPTVAGGRIRSIRKTNLCKSFTVVSLLSSRGTFFVHLVFSLLRRDFFLASPSSLSRFVTLPTCSSTRHSLPASVSRYVESCVRGLLGKCGCSNVSTKPRRWNHKTWSLMVRYRRKSVSSCSGPKARHGVILMRMQRGTVYANNEIVLQYLR